VQIQIELPEEIAQALNAEDLSRAALEALALEGYRSRRLGGGQVQRLLGFSSPMQVHAFLKEHDVYLNYSSEELAKDIEVTNQLVDRAVRQKRSA
jgi:predicted HTH domain antitoxin